MWSGDGEEMEGLMINEYEGSGDLLVLVGEKEAGRLKETFPDLHILAVSGFDWNEMLSPWPAEKVFAKGEDFGGKADELLAALVPAVSRYDKDRYILGYSLAGLFALYACAKMNLFAGCASVSGSLWFPGFAEWLEDHPLRTQYVYLSVGDKEKKARNLLMASVETKTEAVRDMVSGYASLKYEVNPGNHFFRAEERIIKAVRGLTDMKKAE